MVVAAQANTAIAMSALLAVKGRAPMTGYSRAAFGPAWEDVAHDGCDTRDDILSAQLDRVRFLDRCRVASGSEIDPYTGAALFYVRGHSTVDIDHVVSLGDAWQTGAQRLSPARREALANDPLNLLAVSSALNRSKGDSDAASWLPPMKSYRCAYVARQVAVKHRYALWVTGAEHDAFTRILATCPTQVAPTTGASRAPAPATTGPAPIPTPTRTTPARTTPAPPPSTRAPAAPLVVHPGAFCAPAGATGVTVAGTAMICGPASDGRNRWHHA